MMQPNTLSRRTLLAGAFLAPSRYAAAETILDTAVASGRLRAAVLRVESRGSVYEKAFGTARPDSPFLIASITKPMTATAAMLLVDRGKLGFEDPASKYLDGFSQGGRERITIRHLLTHTSGLPDMPPDNIELRKRNAPMSEWVASAKTAPLLFPAGTKTSYQSMGILLAAEVVRRVSGHDLPVFMEREIFKPLGMSGAALGLGRYRLEDTVPNQAEHADPAGGTPETKHWDWNSPWWRAFGAPWGGAHATASDIARFLNAFLHPTGKPLRKETAVRMTQNQNPGLSPYGIGWAVNPRPFGHGGSTGTQCWADAARDATFVLLTSLPARVSQKTILTPVSEAVRSAV